MGRTAPHDDGIAPRWTNPLDAFNNFCRAAGTNKPTWASSDRPRSRFSPCIPVEHTGVKAVSAWIPPSRLQLPGAVCIPAVVDVSLPPAEPYGRNQDSGCFVMLWLRQSRCAVRIIVARCNPGTYK